MCTTDKRDAHKDEYASSDEILRWNQSVATCNKMHKYMATGRSSQAHIVSGQIMVYISPSRSVITMVKSREHGLKTCLVHILLVRMECVILSPTTAED